ncbi:MAG TPA: MarR family transcriptional regulator [Sphingomonas sp.]|nr:MarR family transcriptional regulator [Sphingomonas sp.]
MPSAADHDADTALIARGVLRLARRLRVEAPAGDLSTAALGLLATLHREGPMPGVALAEAEGLQPQSLTRLLASMASGGMIERTPDPVDRRNLIIAITREGRRALRTAMQARRRWLNAALADRLSDSERDTLIAASELMLRLAM